MICAFLKRYQIDQGKRNLCSGSSISIFECKLLTNIQFCQRMWNLFSLEDTDLFLEVKAIKTSFQSWLNWWIVYTLNALYGKGHNYFLVLSSETTDLSFLSCNSRLQAFCLLGEEGLSLSLLGQWDFFPIGIGFLVVLPEPFLLLGREYFVYASQIFAWG